MNDLRELYQEVILEHSKNPRHFGILENSNHHADGFNPLCGDKIKVFLLTNDDCIVDVSFEGSGCAISMAAASMLTDVLIGLTITDANQLFTNYQTMLTTAISEEVDVSSLGKLAVLSGVREFPMRVKCATLASHTLKNALADTSAIANTENEE